MKRQYTGKVRGEPEDIVMVAALTYGQVEEWLARADNFLEADRLAEAAAMLEKAVDRIDKEWLAIESAKAYIEIRLGGRDDPNA